MRNLLTRFALWLCARLRLTAIDADLLGPDAFLDADEADLTVGGKAMRDNIYYRRLALFTPEFERLGLPLSEPFGSERLLIGNDAVERGARWDTFYREQGGLADMILAVRRGYFEGAAALGMSETDKIYEYALADRIAREIDRQVLGVIASGQMEAERIAAQARNKIAQIRR